MSSLHEMKMRVFLWNTSVNNKCALLWTQPRWDYVSTATCKQVILRILFRFASSEANSFQCQLTIFFTAFKDFLVFH